MRQHFEGRRTRPPPLVERLCLLTLQNVPVERFERSKFYVVLCKYNNSVFFIDTLRAEYLYIPPYKCYTKEAHTHEHIRYF